MHDNYIQENDTNTCLDRLKPQYLAMFLSIYQEKDESKARAKDFCDLCLKPALTEYIYKHLGQEIVDDVLSSSGNIIFKSRSFFQATVLESLSGTEEFSNYIKYINSYERFLQSWIFTHISDKYNKSSQLETLQENILFEIVKKIKNVLREEKCLNCSSITNLLEYICKELKKELVISQSEMYMIAFGNNADVEQFSGDIQTFLSETETEILSEVKYLDVESILSKVTLKPQDELLKKVMGCGEQCPFCKVPCEAGGVEHSHHFASIHRPQGLGKYRNVYTNILNKNICSTNVVSNGRFRNADTKEEWHPYKEYRTLYPDWSIQPDPSIESSDYWKYVFVKFNEQFAAEYNAEPAELPWEWTQINKEQAIQSLKDAFNVK
ncbi:Hypothetical predicted protein [Pelobates cultripes]|uniref:Interferon-induced very large GTPase 1 n=1 Tax=Pelobates cultripes TaxID=61616 RepID=A0AAD1STG3_PELCU|nr:Hypothetical predicted protein [Pelobates cultripes]